MPPSGVVVIISITHFGQTCHLHTVIEASCSKEKPMNRSDQQKAIDEIIGEAAFALLQRPGRISLRALMDQLNSMQRLSEDADRQALIALSITDIRKHRSEGDAHMREHNEGSDKVRALFSGSGIPGNNSKH